MTGPEPKTLLDIIPPAELASAGRLSVWPGGSIVRADLPSTYFYLLEEGSAKLVCEPLDASPLIIDIYHAGDFFGEMEMAGLEIHDRSIVALTCCELYRFDQDQFFRLWDQVPAFSRTILTVHCRRLLAAGDDKVSIDGALLSRRVLRVIERHVNAEGWFLYTKQILAELTGISVRSLNRTLNVLRDDGSVEVQAGSIRLLV